MVVIGPRQVNLLNGLRIRGGINQLLRTLPSHLLPSSWAIIQLSDQNHDFIVRPATSSALPLCGAKTHIEFNWPGSVKWEEKRPFALLFARPCDDNHTSLFINGVTCYSLRTCQMRVQIITRRTNKRTIGTAAFAREITRDKDGPTRRAAGDPSRECWHSGPAERSSTTRGE